MTGGDGSDRVGTGTCAVTGTVRSRADLIPLAVLRPKLAARIRADHPGLEPDALVGTEIVARARVAMVEALLADERGDLSDLDRQVTESIAREEVLAENVEATYVEARTLGERLSDGLASFGGSWAFLIAFFGFLAIWMAFNLVTTDPERFDPYPFILLNLVLSCIAAIQAPVIMMSQKRQEAKDRLRAMNDYKVNLKAELEIRHLHEKIDHLMSRQWERLAEIQQLQVEIMEDMARRRE